MQRPSRTPVAIPVAKEIMTRTVKTVPPDSPLEDAQQLLAMHAISGLPVIDGSQLVGMLSESDVLHALATAAFSDLPAGRVRDAMRSSILSASPTTDAFAMADMMRTHHLCRLPITEDGSLVGQGPRPRLGDADSGDREPPGAKAPRRHMGPDGERSPRSRLTPELWGHRPVRSMRKASSSAASSR